MVELAPAAPAPVHAQLGREELKTLLTTALGAAAFALCAIAADARPHVDLHLAGAVVENGHASRTAIEHTVLKAGDLVHFTVSATNSGDAPARKFQPQALIPAHTTYVPGSAHGAQGAVEFSLDGKTWSPKPVLQTKTPGGIISKPADPSLYRAIRWTGSRGLAPKKTAIFSYDVRVNGHAAGAR